MADGATGAFSNPSAKSLNVDAMNVDAMNVGRINERSEGSDDGQ